MEKKKTCSNCFFEYSGNADICPVCGYRQSDNDRYESALSAGSILGGRYILGRVLGRGGFGITYVALDTKTNTRVAIKEFFPENLARRERGTAPLTVSSGEKLKNFEYGLHCFIEEARVLAKFKHPNIIGVQACFKENGTAYFVMDYVDGRSLKEYLNENGGKISWEKAAEILLPVMSALEVVHKEGLIHRDVAPDNIFMTNNGEIKLIDFGSARYTVGDQTRTLDVFLKQGYAPKEQYTRKGRQGPFTDIYSLGACFYGAITGFVPPESLDRIEEDNLVPPSRRGIHIPDELEDAILKALEINAVDRFQHVREFAEIVQNALDPVLNEESKKQDTDGESTDITTENKEKSESSNILTKNTDNKKKEKIHKTKKKKEKNRQSLDFSKIFGNLKNLRIVFAGVLIIVLAAGGGTLIYNIISSEPAVESGGGGSGGGTSDKAVIGNDLLNSKAQDAYKVLLSGNKLYSHYALYDIDKDGVNELLVGVTGSSGASVAIYSYIDGEPVSIGAIITYLDAFENKYMFEHEKGIGFVKKTNDKTEYGFWTIENRALVYHPLAYLTISGGIITYAVEGAKATKEEYEAYIQTVAKNKITNYSTPEIAETTTAAASTQKTTTAPAQTAPAQTAPKQTAPTQSTPKQSTPAQTAPKQSAPAQTAPKQSTPAQTAPKQTAPAQSTPAQSAPAQSAPAQSTPAQSAPAQSTPAQSAPAQSAPPPVNRVVPGGGTYGSDAGQGSTKSLPERKMEFAK